MLSSNFQNFVLFNHYIQSLTLSVHYDYWGTIFSLVLVQICDQWINSFSSLLTLCLCTENGIKLLHNKNKIIKYREQWKRKIYLLQSLILKLSVTKTKVNLLFYQPIFNTVLQFFGMRKRDMSGKKSRNEGGSEWVL